MLAEYKLTLSPVSESNAHEITVQHLQNARKKLGFVPNMYGVMGNSAGLLDTYINGYERFRELSGLTPVEQEVVLLTISRQNGCAYCVAAHSFIADRMSGVPEEITDAIRDGRSISDSRLAVLHDFIRTMVVKRGLPDKADVGAFLAAGYSEAQVLEIILEIAVKTLSNYANHVFHTPVDDAFAGRVWTD